jgi:tRNA(Arg) A34 adenosine deaminase TadA
MAKSDVRRYFEMAAEAAMSVKDNRTFFLGAVARRNDGVMVISRNGSTPYPNRSGHAETRLCKKLDPGTTVYVVRVRVIDGGYGMARPCVNCQKCMLSRHVKQVYYSINPDQFGIWDIKTDSDRVYSLN